MKRGSDFLCALTILTALALCAPMAVAGVPQMINYQGTLTDAGGTAVPNGNYDIEFRMYDVASGGASLWSERWDTTTSQVPVVGGVFNAMLGFQSPIPASFFADHPVTYLGIKVGTDTEMLPRQQITSVGYAFNAGNGVPKGVISMWSGSIATIPAGWALCDGNNGTPDLRERFVVGAGNGYGVGSIGGAASHTLTVNEMPGHAHGVTDPGHSHGITTDNDTDTPWPYGASGNNADGTVNTNAAVTGISVQSSGLGQAHNNLPPYFALAYIMKI